MKIKLVGTPEVLSPLSAVVTQSLEELGLASVVTVESTDDAGYISSLGITKFPALCIEEESIDFRDMIFEGVVPQKQELVSMFISILGGDSSGSSCSSGGCSSCGPSGCGTC